MMAILVSRTTGWTRNEVYSMSELELIATFEDCEEARNRFPDFFGLKRR